MQYVISEVGKDQARCVAPYTDALLIHGFHAVEYPGKLMLHVRHAPRATGWASAFFVDLWLNFFAAGGASMGFPGRRCRHTWHDHPLR